MKNFILIVLSIVSLFSVCSCVFTDSSVAVTPKNPWTSVEKIREERLQALGAATQIAFEEPAQMVHYAKKMQEECLDEMSRTDYWSEEQRHEIHLLLRQFVAMEYKGKTQLAFIAYEDELLNGNSAAMLLDAMKKFHKILEEDCKRPCLWKYEDMKEIAQKKAVISNEITDLNTISKKVTKEVHDEVVQRRRKFENDKAGDYYERAKKEYNHQDRKWFNWGITGRWRDEEGSMEMIADYCWRIIEARYVSDAIVNKASSLLSDAYDRMSKKELTNYKEYHRNRIQAIASLFGYPQEMEAKFVDMMIIDEFRKAIGIQVQQPSLDQAMMMINGRH